MPYIPNGRRRLLVLSARGSDRWPSSPVSPRVERRGASIYGPAGYPIFAITALVALWDLHGGEVGNMGP